MNTSKGINSLTWLVLILLMSAYVVYQHATDENAIDMQTQIERHHRMIDGQSEFFNPWQYRVFSAYLLQSIIVTYDAVFPGKPESIPYLLLHFAQMVLIFYLCLLYYQKLGLRNPFLLATGLLILCYCVSTSVFQSDLSFNTYFDIVFYVAAAIVILTGQYQWIIPIILLAALNRETSGFIPLMLLAPFSLNFGPGFRSRLIISAISLAVFAVVFFGVRYAYGFRPAVGIHGMNSPADFFVFNVTFFRMYPLLLGTLSIIPLVVVLNLGKLPVILRHWFWLIVPFWFVIHLVMGTAMETRLFLVPQALIFIPALLILIDYWYSENIDPSTPRKKEWIA